VSSDAFPQAFAFVEAALDRAAELRERNDALMAAWQAPTAALLSLRGDGRVLLDARQALHVAPPTESGTGIDGASFLGLRAGQALFSRVLDDATAAARASAIGGRFADLRTIAGQLPAADAGLAAYARALAHWQSRKRWCGVCGSPTRLVHGGHRAECGNEACAATYFPRTDPAIIVIVADGGRCLLGRQASWPAGRYSTLAGFVEPGESLEQAVAREVHEEAGVRIEDCRYLASQPWPFPASLMLGFEARAREQTVQTGAELESARWFDAHELAPLIARGELGLPPATSISFHLIDHWYRRVTGGAGLPPGLPLASR
jgi:NAD+ diphosphatase